MKKERALIFKEVSDKAALHLNYLIVFWRRYFEVKCKLEESKGFDINREN